MAKFSFQCDRPNKQIVAIHLDSNLFWKEQPTLIKDNCDKIYIFITFSYSFGLSHLYLVPPIQEKRKLSNTYLC